MHAIIYSKSDCMDGQVLKNVTRGIYLMQCNEEPRLLRYGQIGAGGALDVTPSDRNNASQRLKQVRATWRLDNASRRATFNFVLLCHLQNFSRRMIKQAETAIQVAMRNAAGTWGSSFKNEGSAVLRYKDDLRVLAAPHDAFLLNTQADVEAVAAMVADTIALYLASCTCPVVLTRSG